MYKASAISDLNIIVQYFQKLEYTRKEANSSAIDDIIKYLQKSKPAENNGIQDLINVSIKSQQMKIVSALVSFVTYIL